MHKNTKRLVFPRINESPILISVVQETMKCIQKATKESDWKTIDVAYGLATAKGGGGGINDVWQSF